MAGSWHCNRSWVGLEECWYSIEPLPSPAKFQKQEGHGGLSGPCQYVDGPQKFLLEFGLGGETIEASSTG